MFITKRKLEKLIKHEVDKQLEGVKDKVYNAGVIAARYYPKGTMSPLDLAIKQIAATVWECEQKDGEL